MMPSSKSPLADLTTPCRPPSVTFWASAGGTTTSKEQAKARSAISAAARRPCAMRQHTTRLAIVASLSARAIARIGRGTIGVPATLLPHIAHEVVQIRIAQCVLVGGHRRSAIEDLRFHVVIVHRL